MARQARVSSFSSNALANSVWPMPAMAVRSFRGMAAMAGSSCPTPPPAATGSHAAAPARWLVQVLLDVADSTGEGLDLLAWEAAVAAQRVARGDAPLVGPPADGLGRHAE